MFKRNYQKKRLSKAPWTKKRSFTDMSNAPKRSLGQNFLVSKEVISEVIDEVRKTLNDFFSENLTGSDKQKIKIIEIGPGKAALTLDLVDLASKFDTEIFLVEKDDQLSQELSAKFINQKNIKVFNEDFLDFDVEKELSARTKTSTKEENINYIAVGSLPYNISKKIIRKLLLSDNPPYRSIFILQKEVAENYCQKSGKATFLSTVTNLVADTKIIAEIDPQAFSPIPKVKSSIIRFDKKLYVDKVDKTEIQSIEAFIKICFLSPGKTLLNNLSSKYDKVTCRQIIEKMFQDVNIRARRLTLDDFILLQKNLEKENAENRNN